MAFSRRLSHEVDGRVEPGFESVLEVFKKNFKDGLDQEGSSFAVWYDGKLVVDLWGGYADSLTGRKWTENTLTTAFSVTKSVSALCLAILVDRGLLSYDDLVITHWPEFGKHGKDKITVKMLASHEAGLVALDEPITFEMIRDWKKMSAVLENQKPNWESGTGYHLLTYGWLIDQLLRRTDQKNRSLGQFFREEIGDPYDIDFYIGLPPEHEHRVTKLKRPSMKTMLGYLFQSDIRSHGWQMLGQSANSIFKRAAANPVWLQRKKSAKTVNSPEFHALEIGAGNGIGTARALAKLYGLIDAGKLIKQTTLDILLQPVWVDTVDLTLHDTVTWGYGFYHTKNPDGKYQIGHPGYGGQFAKYDTHNKLSFVYLRNDLIFTDGTLQCKSLVNLERSVYEVLQRKK